MKPKSIFYEYKFLDIIFQIFIFILFFSSSWAFSQTTVMFNTTGAGTWVVPSGVNSVIIEVWGGGGGGQSVALTGVPATGGGGSGGGYVRTEIAVIPNKTYNFYIGKGGDGSPSTLNNGTSSWFGNSMSILAVGGIGAGSSATNLSNGTGSSAPITGNIGGTILSTYGGNGGTPTSVTSNSGGGGSSAGNVNGNNAVTNVGGVAPANGYVGANGTSSNGAIGNPGGVGAGGSGSKKGTGSATPNGGLGGNGQIRITYYCAPTSTNPADTYITSFKFVGTLNDPPLNANITTFNTGYNDYTSLTPIAQQVDGSVVNVEAISNKNSYWKAYVDFNNDGVFDDPGELVYSRTASFTNAITFGFVIPAGQTPGTYRLRIIANNDSTTFGPCTANNNAEIEDYSFEVLYNCPAKVTSINSINPNDGHRCGTGSVVLTATGNGTNYNWYTTLTGGSAVFTGSTFNTPSISTSTTYYVTAINGTCESGYRIPVIARIDPLAVITFTTTPSFCGVATAGLTVSGYGDQYVDTIVDESFDNAAPSTGVFQEDTLGTYAGSDGFWQNRPSPFVPTVPPYQGLSPAISSGYFGGNYAAIVTDIIRSTSSLNEPILNGLTLTTGKDLTNFQSLFLDFDLYYYSITNDPTQGYLKVQYSLDGGSTWITLSTITTIQGTPLTWKRISLPIPGPYTSTQFKVRFLVFSDSFYSGGSTTWFESIAAVDNIKVYGSKPITTGFTWTDPASLIYDKTCTTLLGSTKTDQICIKPNETQIENDTSWTIAATASFNNGCDASNSIVVPNNTKTWNPVSASTDWNSTTDWKPTPAIVPDISKCVIIRKPVILNLGSDGAAKNILIETGGSLQIMAPRTLTIDDYLNNSQTADKVNFESDANLLQNNPTALNVGSITAKRNTVSLRNNPGTAVDYVYWGTPVQGQQTFGIGGFSPLTPSDHFFDYRESNDYFYPTSDTSFLPGKGYAVKAEGIANKTYTFSGTPNNGSITYNITKSADNPAGTVHGYNLVSNPYPSNITFNELYLGNSSLIYNTAWFWTNNAYEPNQKGSAYNGNNYSVFNGSGGNPATYNSTYGGNVTSNGTITVGQAFIVQAKIGGPLNFQNSFGPGHVLRTGSAGTGFFQKGAATGKNRFWLSLINPETVTNTLLIGYINGATDGFEQDYDNEACDTFDDLFYSSLDGKKLLIQGKGPNFTKDDVISLGANIYESGTYTISIYKSEGIFQNGQNIYLKDKETGIVTNLSEKNYTFQAVKGLSEGRFEIIYKPGQALSTGEVTNQNLVIYREANDFVVKASQKIKDLSIYDVSGRLILNLKPLSTENIINANQLINGVYVLRISLENGDIVTKKIRK